MPKPNRGNDTRAALSLVKGEAVDIQKKTIRDAAALVSSLTIGSIAWLISLIVGIITLTWTVSQAVSRSPVASAASDTADNNVTCEAAGLTCVVPAMSSAELASFLGEAKESIIVVVPWFIEPLSVRDSLVSILNNPDAEVTIYFLDPLSPHLAERGRVAQPTVLDYGPRETRRSISLLAPAFETARATARIFLYDSIPSAYIGRADNSGFIGFHMHTGVAPRNPILRFMFSSKGQTTRMGAMAKDEFSALHKLAREVDLTSVTTSAEGVLSYSFKSR